MKCFYTRIFSMKNWYVALYCALLLFSANSSQAIGKTFYVDPAKGSQDGDGSKSRPWHTLEEVFADDLISTQRLARKPYLRGIPLVPKFAKAPVHAGDTIVLMSGYHGQISIFDAYNKKTITIAAGEGQTPKLGSLHLRGAAKWKFHGLTISPEFATRFERSSIVHFESHAYHGPTKQVTIQSSTIYGVANTSGWTANEWNAHAADGITASGSHFSIRNNRLKNIHFGIVTRGNDILAKSNVIENYSADGMRGAGDRITFEGNTIEWSYKVDDNHDDAIQFYQSGRKACHDIVIRGNTIRSYPDPKRPLVHGSQGIGNFDGPYVGWVVENNVVMVSNFHGISLFGAKDSRIVNNTVYDITGKVNSWIRLDNATNCTVRNNLAMAFRSKNCEQLTSDHNIELPSDVPHACFKDMPNGDLSLKADGKAVDAGEATLAPTEDITGSPRPSGAGVDVGAYEFVPSP